MVRERGREGEEKRRGGWNHHRARLITTTTIAILSPATVVGFIFFSFILLFYLTDRGSLFLVLLAISAIRVSIPGWMTADMAHLYLHNRPWPSHRILSIHSVILSISLLLFPSISILSVFLSLLSLSVFLLNQPHGKPLSNHSPAFPEDPPPYHCAIPKLDFSD